MPPPGTPARPAAPHDSGAETSPGPTCAAPPTDAQIAHAAHQLLTVAAELTAEQPDHPGGPLGHLYDCVSAAAECNELPVDEETLARIEAAARTALAACCGFPAYLELTAEQLAAHLFRLAPGRLRARLDAAADNLARA
jgi:hypothetical protein